MVRQRFHPICVRSEPISDRSSSMTVTHALFPFVFSISPFLCVHGFCFSLRHSPFESPITHTGLILAGLGAAGGLCLSFNVMALHTYLAFYFEAWLTERQPWHSCRRSGACYYECITILINTWPAIEEIITCHHSTVWERNIFYCTSVCTNSRTQDLFHKYDLCYFCCYSSINDLIVASHWKALPRNLSFCSLWWTSVWQPPK